MKTEEYMESEYFSIFLVKMVDKSTVIVTVGGPTLSCLCSVMSFSEK